MSQIVKAIVAVDSGDRKVLPKGLSPLFTNVFNKREEWTETTTSTHDVVRLYRIGVTLGNTAAVNEHEVFKSGHSPLEEAVDRTKKTVIEAVFGEFRSDFRLIEQALYNYDYEQARFLLNKFEDRMFSTE
jgi:hypothetical protein